MPYRTFGVDEVAKYLHLSRGDVERLVKAQDIPFEKQGQRLVFRKVEIDAWASPRILGLQGKGLAEYHQKTSSGARATAAREALMPEMIEPGFIHPALPAKTRASVLREMVVLAERTHRVLDRDALRLSVEAREDLCSTGVPGGLALLHTRNPEPYMFETPFLALGRTVQQIPFGSPDGRPTDLFFLLGCPDERMHLHILARLCLMAQKTPVLAELREAADAETMCAAIINAEQAVLALPAMASGHE